MRTIVAWYAHKPPELVDVVERVQGEAGRLCGAGFTPRPLPDVHATVLGLEDAGARADPDGLLRHLVAELEREPVDVQFGGFSEDDRRMLSRGRTLYERSVGVQDGSLVLFGWPMAPGPSPRLGVLRRGCERFGFRHKYHRRPDDLDPDVHLVLGEITGPVPAGLVDRLRREVLVTPVRVPITAGVVGVVEYVDPALPAASSTWWPIGSARG